MVLPRRIARLGKSEETLKLEALFRKAAKASTVAQNTKAAAQTDTATDTDSEVQRSQSDGGYDGRSMSNRARRAYENGEMPLSKWTKSAMVEAILDSAVTREIDVAREDIERLTVSELRSNFLRKSSWHHTGALYNATDFWSINEDALTDIRNKINRIVEQRGPKTTISSEEQARKKAAKDTRQRAKDLYTRLALVHKSGVTGLRTVDGVVRRWMEGKIDEAVIDQAIQKRIAEEKSRVDSWRKLPQDHWRQADVERFDADPEAYVLAEMKSEIGNGGRSMIGKIADHLSEPSSSETQKHPTEAGEVQYSLPYMDAIDQLSEETLDRSQNTHLMVLEHTPEIYIKKANAKDLKIVMRWDIAYLAMNKNGDIPGHYHGLGKYVLKAIPSALEHPLYVVKQNNGRIAVVTEVVVKRARSVFVSVELDAFQSTTQEGKQESKNYNLIVTVMDAQPNYLQNTIFGGEIVYNKNDEDPAHFILRLKSLKKALPNDDHAKSSVTIIPDPPKKSNPQPSEDSSGDDSVQHSLPAISKEVADAVFEETPDTSDPSTSLQYSLAPKRKIAYNEFWTEVHSWAHRATTNAGDMRVISDTRKGARPNTFCLFEADGDGDCTEIARGSYLEVLEEYERAYAKTIDEVYVCVEAYGADKGRDIWDMPPDEIGRYALGDYDTLEGLEFQRFPAGNVEYLRSGDQEISINDDIQLSLPDQTASEYLKKMLADEAIAKATKAQIYADSPLYDVLHDDDRFAAAREILR